MSLHGTHEPHVAPASALETYLTVWLLLVMVLGGGLGYFATDLVSNAIDANASELSSRATRVDGARHV